MTAQLFLSTLVTLLVTVDPVGLFPIFLALTGDLSGEARRGIALRAVTIASAILILFVLIGKKVLLVLGIGLPAFRIGGGILLFWIAFEMVFEGRTERKRETAEGVSEEPPLRDLAAFPLAIPLMAGPGAITAVILISSQTDGNAAAALALILLILFVMGVCFVSFVLADRLAAVLGRTGSIVLTRLLGVLLTALSVQFVVDGVEALLPAAR